jgi:type III secretion protein J
MIRQILVAVALLTLAACGKVELYGKLTETQANEMVAVLQNAGISAAKSNNGEKGFAIETTEPEFARAVQLLRAHGFPRDEFASLGTFSRRKASSRRRSRSARGWSMA